MQARTISEQIQARLKEQIVSGERTSGERLVHEALAKEFSVSITPIRDAVSALAVQGFVELNHGNRAVVRSLTSQDLGRLYDVRKLLEGYAAKLASANISDALYEELSLLCQEMVSETDPTKWYGMNDQFHSKLYAASRNEYLCQSINQLRQLSEPYLRRYMANTDLKAPALEHIEILSFAKSCKPGDVESAIKAHLETTQKRLLTAMPL